MDFWTVIGWFLACSGSWVLYKALGPYQGPIQSKNVELLRQFVFDVRIKEVGAAKPIFTVEWWFRALLCNSGVEGADMPSDPRIGDIDEGADFAIWCNIRHSPTSHELTVDCMILGHDEDYVWSRSWTGGRHASAQFFEDVMAALVRMAQSEAEVRSIEKIAADMR